VSDLPVIYAQYFLLSSNGRKFFSGACPYRKTVANFLVKALTSHAYAEYRHAAQSFALPKFRGTQHHTFDSTCREYPAPGFAFWEEGLSEGF
jgi:hypothetical protein